MRERGSIAEMRNDATWVEAGYPSLQYIRGWVRYCRKGLVIRLPANSVTMLLPHVAIHAQCQECGWRLTGACPSLGTTVPSHEPTARTTGNQRYLSASTLSLAQKRRLATNLQHGDQQENCIQAGNLHSYTIGVLVPFAKVCCKGLSVMRVAIKVVCVRSGGHSKWISITEVRHLE